MFRLAIDAMGGDDAPQVVIEGLALAQNEIQNFSFHLFGCQDQILPLIKKYNLKNYEIFHTDQFIPVDMKPTQALRGLENSSMRLALQSVARGDVDGVISAGNTGAYLALCRLIIKPLDCIRRPAIIGQIPTLRGRSVMLDLGGNLQVDAEALIEFALMGHVFASHILGTRSPSIGLLNVGSENSKGLPLLREVAKRLSASELNFYGFIEGYDISRGTVDVVVTDGFTGNVALKTGEGVMKFMVESLKREYNALWYSKILGLMLAPMMKRVKRQIDPSRFNGAVWAGLAAPAVKSHGGVNAAGFAYAVRTLADLVRQNINMRLATDMLALRNVVQ